MVCAILAIALVMLSGTVASTSRLFPSSRDNYMACQAASNKIEEMRNEELSDIFRMYNGIGADDPLGPGTAPGAGFAAPGLTPLPGDPDGMAGEILFPEQDGQLREDFVSTLLGTPRDLNCDAGIDDGDHADDWVILPVVIRVEWQSSGGPRKLEVPTMIARYE